MMNVPCGTYRCFEAVGEQRSEPVEISAVVPAFNEVESLTILIPALFKVLGRLRKPFEVIVVDDGSSDGSRHLLRKMKAEPLFLHPILLKKNYGLSTALLAGMREGRGKVIVTIDSDLQNDPEDIPKLMEHLGNSDTVTGSRQKREDPWLKKVSSRIANSVRNRLSGETIRDSACTLRVFKKECLGEIPVFNGVHRFLPTLTRIEGYRVLEVPVEHHPRRFGRSKYNIRNRLWRAFIDLLAVRWMKSRHIHLEVEERT
jgi:glycosyltransferase involved in cell wall biosynthesis